MRVDGSTDRPHTLEPKPVAEFLDYLAAERNFSGHTIRSYRADLVQFCQFLCADRPLDSEIQTSADLPPLEADDCSRLAKMLLDITPQDVRAEGLSDPAHLQSVPHNAGQ